MEKNKIGRLIVIPTPIGNLEDITLRSLRMLKEVDLIVCEDTRTTGFLLKHYNIVKPLLPFHLHNEHKIVNQLVSQIKDNGATVGLCCDAGTPGISDPGYLLVHTCVQNGITVETLPGATALIPALVCSGFASEKFVYEGFLPLRKGRTTRLRELASEKRTIILYESPHRIVKLLHEIKDYFGEDRLLCIGREITKKFEEYIRGSIIEIIHKYEGKSWKGELVIVLQGLSNG